ncbi:MAG: cysteine--tRNA ligase [Candidatus Faecisoma sp.]|jgi:cysteinyl-tRNA synthetase|nr:cysteine--tRNA ligase [Acholeplasma sp.]MCI5677670.1 cysteine--tRNA ligase [Acholeplasma sp.]MDY2892748.1 cysteine--tRNA ligase [Candidatus Faecisoma sp.]
MKIYNTLTKQIDEFKPHDGNNVKMYTCGPTVYHFAHIGNLRTYIFEDIFEKGLNYLGYNVKRVMNITDVGHLTSDSDTGEDKMLKGARREHKTVYEIADFYTKAFFEDTKKLNIKKPETVEKASDHIDFYIKMIEKLIEKDYAYLSNGNVYFDISKANDYYKLSGKSSNDLIVGAREDVDLDIHKKNPADFVLWFTTSKFENQAMVWDSPWGVGYPGWHIECSGISIQFLGEYLDIHCGGVDNIFPHHTNEIAQSEAYLGHKWCPYWVHGEHLNDQSGKMSKSNGEFLTLSLLEEKGYNPLVYRLFCLQSHYRNQLVFSYDALDTTKNTYQKLKNKINTLKDSENQIDESAFNKYQEKFKDAISNDLNTSLMLTTLYDVLKADINDDTKLKLISSFDTVLSLDLLKTDEANSTNDLDKELLKHIEEKIEERKQAKQNKNFELADKIRDELLNEGIIIKDTREGVTYEVIK